MEYCDHRNISIFPAKLNYSIQMCKEYSWFAKRLVVISILIHDRGVYIILHNLFSREFYIHGSVHRDSILIRSNEMQKYAGIYLLQNYSTCFGCLSNPSSGVHKTVTAASGTCHTVKYRSLNYIYNIIQK